MTYAITQNQNGSWKVTDEIGFAFEFKTYQEAYDFVNGVDAFYHAQA